MISVGVVNAGLRLVALGSRFALSLFLARFLSLHDVGSFALLSGLVSFLPPLSGLGMNYFVMRTIVNVDHRAAVRDVRDRLLVSLIGTLFCLAAILVLERAGVDLVTIALPSFVAIVLLETLAFDLHLFLLARSHSALANLLLAIRSGLWIPFYIAAAYVHPAYRSIDAVALFWLAGLVACYAIILCLHAEDVVRLGMEGLHGLWRRVGSIIAAAPKIYLSDIGLAGSIYVDRFVVSSLIGVKAAGIYFFYTSILNAVYIICMASTVQVYAPQFRTAYVEGGLAALHEIADRRLRHTLLIAVPAILCALPATVLVVRLMHKPELLANTMLLPFAGLAYAAKSASDCISAAIAAAERDDQFAAFNIVGLILTILCCAAGILLLGLIGAAIGLMIASLVALGLRVRAWRALRDAP